MSRVAAASVLLTVLLAAAPVAQAQECFCLSHASGAVLRGCDTPNKNDDDATALCTDPETGKKSVVQKITTDWKRIEAGAQGCVVCRAPPRGTARELPRGGDDK